MCVCVCHRLISIVSDVQLPSDMHKWQVSDIVNNGSWFFRDQALLPLWNLITQQPILGVVGNDKWKLTCSSTGLFSLKSAWNVVRERDSDFSWQILSGSFPQSKDGRMPVASTTL